MNHSGSPGIRAIDVWDVLVTSITKVGSIGELLDDVMLAASYLGILGDLVVVDGFALQASSVVIPADRVVVAVYTADPDFALLQYETQDFDDVWVPGAYPDGSGVWRVVQNHWTPVPFLVKSDGTNVRLTALAGNQVAEIFYIYFEGS